MSSDSVTYANPRARDAVAYAAQAQRYRPTEPGQVAAEIRRLHTTGLTDRDFATALQMSHNQALNILAICP